METTFSNNKTKKIDLDSKEYQVKEDLRSHQIREEGCFKGV
jgi:hypothetical protein